MFFVQSLPLLLPHVHCCLIEETPLPLHIQIIFVTLIHINFLVYWISLYAALVDSLQDPLFLLEESQLKLVPEILGRGWKKGVWLTGSYRKY